MKGLKLVFDRPTFYVSLDTGMKCGSPGTPLNGFIVSLDFRYGSNVTYKCLKSHILRGASGRTCTNGTWDNEVPTCERKAYFIVLLIIVVI